MMKTTTRKRFIFFCFLAATGAYSQVTDINGTKYMTVTAAGLEWTNENLAVKSYNNGDPIPQVQDAEQWTKLESGAWCYYTDSAKKTTAVLYNWYAVHDRRGLAPAGWRIPTKTDWQKFVASLGGEEIAGKKMKFKWGSCSGTNESGFKAFMCGKRFESGEMSFYDNGGYWWCSDEPDGARLNCINVSCFIDKVYFFPSERNEGYSLRCVRNPPNTPQLNQTEITDRDNNRYKTVKIGEQNWMAENLNTAVFRNGDKISEAKTPEEWIAAATKQQPAWCYYQVFGKETTTYGKLYNWYAVNDPRGLAPEGWHVPSADEWKALSVSASAEISAGTALKSKTGWMEGGNGTDQFGFNGTPGGERNAAGKFLSVNQFGRWWTSTPYEDKSAWHCKLWYNSPGLSIDNGSWVSAGCGFAVRCVKD